MSYWAKYYFDASMDALVSVVRAMRDDCDCKEEVNDSALEPYLDMLARQFLDCEGGDQIFLKASKDPTLQPADLRCLCFAILEIGRAAGVNVPRAIKHFVDAGVEFNEQEARQLCLGLGGFCLEEIKEVERKKAAEDHFRNLDESTAEAQGAVSARRL